MGGAARPQARRRPRLLARGLLTLRALTLLAAALALPALAAPSAEAGFDPPDGTVISANLPASVPLAYRIDLDAQCGAGQSATVAAWVRDPSGAERRVHQDGGYGSAFEASFGVELSAYGTYTRWLDVACASGTRRVEEGGFSVVRGNSRARRVERCAKAKRSQTKARKRYRRARTALRREQTEARRRAVRRTRAKLRKAKRHRRAVCARR